MKNKEIASLFDRIADALEFKGEQFFRILAYRKAARIIEELTDDIELLNQQDKLREIPGIGEGIAKKINEYLTIGKMKKLDEAMTGISKDLLDLLNIQNLGPKTLRLAYDKLEVQNLADLKKVIANGSLANQFRMGEKKVENISKGIQLFEQAHARIPINVALAISENVIHYMKKAPGITNINASGSLRRMKETIGDIDILIAGKNGKKIVDYFTRMPGVIQVLAAGDTKGSVIIKTDTHTLQVDIRIIDKNSYGAALQYFTGSKEHNVRIRSLAKEMGLKVSEYGVFKGKNKITGKTEKEVYKALKLPCFAPELREDRGEIQAALEKRLPRLIGYDEIKGDLQMHSTYSDGANTIEQMANAAIKMGYQYIAITDHSKTASYANGLNESRVKKQWSEIDRINRKLKPFRIFKAIEVDILPNGKLDFPDKILSQFDLVVASIHQGFKHNATKRMCNAIENPYVRIIAHPSGRLISRRAGYDIDLEKVLLHAAKYHKIMEINAYPDRIDLNDIWARKAKDLGIKIAINTDAHETDDLNWVRFGVGVARRAWLEKADVINTLTLPEFLKLFNIQ